MKRYEGLFILNSAGREEVLKDTLDKISAEITSSGGKVETVQKMEKKAFARVANRKNTAGFYVNVVFESEPGAISQLRHRLGGLDDVFRVVFTLAPAPKPEAK